MHDASTIALGGIAIGGVWYLVKKLSPLFDFDEVHNNRPNQQYKADEKLIRVDMNEIYSLINTANDPGEIVFEYEAFNEWARDFEKLPFLRDNYYLIPNYQNTPEKFTFKELVNALIAFTLTLQNHTTLPDVNAWIGGHGIPQEFFDVKISTFTPYAQKLIVPVGSEISFHGDLHGDAHSLVAYINELQDNGYLNGFKIIKDNFYMIFLGDYVDRGCYGAEVIFTILRLKATNPNQVFMVRGNHEDQDMNIQDGFAGELHKKFPGAHKELVYNMYNMLPVVLYVGSGSEDHLSFIECCHGGKEIGFTAAPEFFSNPAKTYQRISSLDRAKNMQKLLKKKLLSGALTWNLGESNKLINQKKFITTDLGFLWSDYIINENPEKNRMEYALDRCERGFQYSKAIVVAINKYIESKIAPHKIVGNFRAHQHDYDLDGMMGLILDKQGLDPNSKGVGKLWRNKSDEKATLWNNIVCTFNVSPDSYYGADEATGFNFDTYGILHTGKHYPADWKLDVYRNNIFENKKNK